MSEVSIHVLEDMDYRVNWLKENFPGVRIFWSTNVTEFFDKLNKHPAPSLIILDHDLGEDRGGWGAQSEDRDGLCGTDVAKRLDTTRPVLVWSMNSVAGPEMTRKLRDRGVSAVCVPFFDHHKATLYKLIEETLKNAEAVL
jgi:hypothetical protein